MSLEITPLALPEVKVIRLRKIADNRGFFSETYNRKVFNHHGIDAEFVQDNHSYSALAGTVRGLHFQIPPFTQDKLIRVSRGRILDVAVDIRRDSPDFGKWVVTELSAEIWNQLFVPAGFAHAYCTLEPDTEVAYKVTNFHSPPHERGIRWNDPDLNIPWPFDDRQVLLSERDRALPFFRDQTDTF